MGRKYAVFDANGFPQAFYDDEIHVQIPQEAVAITEEQWLEFINNQGRRRWNFQTNTVEVYEPPPPSLDELKARLGKQLFLLAKQRLQEVLEQYGYFSLGDIQLYASQNDTEAQAILDWYSNANGTGYDDLVWSYINSLPNKTKTEILNDLQDLKAVEEQIFQQSVQNNPLP